MFVCGKRNKSGAGNKSFERIREAGRKSVKQRRFSGGTREAAGNTFLGAEAFIYLVS